MTTPAFDGRDYNGRIVAKAGPYVATRRTGDRHCEVRVVTAQFDHPNCGRLVGVAHSDSAARVMVREMGR